MRRWLKGLAVTLLAAVAFLFFGVLPWFLAGLFTARTFQMPDKENEGVTPASLGLGFEDVSFQSRDGVPLSGWWVPADGARGTVVLVHGLNRSRAEMVRKAPFIARAGWNALPFDLRRHGKSGGERRSLGAGERLDVLGAFDYAKSRDRSPVVVWGISFGGAASVLAAAEEPGIAGIVCDSSYRSLRDTASHHLALFRQFASRRSSSGERPPVTIRMLRAALPWVPLWPTADLTLFWMGRRGGFDPDALDIAKAAERLRGRPALFVAGSGDERMPADIAQDLARAAGEKASVLVVDSERHGHAYQDGTDAYERAVTDLLDAVAPAGALAPKDEGAKP
ncbi:MAG TPA: alpha/beta fold hydrolase [Vicinamibacteria bacterium]|nr:alpha/beta fold hydrolase [Vicinamibacteria bacterium]